MLDADTMRIALGAVSLTVLLLFYLGVYRPTRSSFSGWWTLSLLSAGASNALLMLNGSDLHAVANPASTVLAAIGATCVWFATRSLRRERLPMWLIGVAPAAIVLPVLMDERVGDAWAGNGPLYSYMALMFVASSIEMWRAWRTRRANAEHELNREAVVALLVIAVAASGLAAFYVLRILVHFAAGPESRAFETTAGSGPEVALLMIGMVAVTFGVSAIGWDEQTQELRCRAMHDDLTGLLGRTEFRLQAESAFARARSTGTCALLVVADLDHFKGINDVHGHAAGDGALVEFAKVLKDSLRPGEIVGRMGGEEFGVMLLGVDGADANARLEAISEAFAARSSGFDFALPTVSYGLAGLEDGDSVAEIYEHADLALYRAKADGRDRVVRYSRDLGRRGGRVRTGRAADRRDDSRPDEPDNPDAFASV
ncbi:diguanylate cyclase domain-containing protein [Demequina sp. SO4-18]|uniref:diguanylate cyclase domain-containing protein n=1 Tax=Demequina sp. SO4-18 TaxID=3401026 RepID=UPI003B58C1B8